MKPKTQADGLSGKSVEKVHLLPSVGTKQWPVGSDSGEGEAGWEVQGSGCPYGVSGLP